MNRTVLYVTGFSPNLRARDLAWEFERYGRLVRCDIPALKSASATPFAFVEFRREDDAEDAYYDMHGRSIDGRRVTVQWAKRPPSSAWRHEDFRRGGGGGGRDDRDRGGSYGRRSPPPRGRSPSPPPRRRSPSPRYERERDYDRRGGRDGDSVPRELDRDETRGGVRERERSRSRSPRDEPRADDRSLSPVGNGKAARSVSPGEERDPRDD